jgi:pimeloyl-ACP methyl ester carboxylesterase
MARTKAHAKTEDSPVRVKVLRALHGAAATVYRAQGYKWEEYRFDGYKIGVWRKRTLVGRLRRGKTHRGFVLVPGFGDSSLSWFTTLKILEPLISTLYDEIALLDFPGFSGYLHEEECFHSLDLMLKSGSALLSRLNAHTVLGHSLGGWIASYHAAMARKKPERIILVSPSGVFDSEQSKQQWAKLFGKIRKSGDFADLRPHVFHKEPVWFPLVAREFARFVGNRDIQTFMASVTEDDLVENLLPQLKSDVWFLWGEKDTLVPIQLLEGWTRRLPARVAEKQCLRLKGIGHTPQLESPAKVAAAVAKILVSAPKA